MIKFKFFMTIVLCFLNFAQNGFTQDAVITTFAANPTPSPDCSHIEHIKYALTRLSENADRITGSLDPHRWGWLHAGNAAALCFYMGSARESVDHVTFGIRKLPANSLSPVELYSIIRIMTDVQFILPNNCMVEQPFHEFNLRNIFDALTNARTQSLLLISTLNYRFSACRNQETASK